MARHEIAVGMERDLRLCTDVLTVEFSRILEARLSEAGERVARAEAALLRERVGRERRDFEIMRRRKR